MYNVCYEYISFELEFNCETDNANLVTEVMHYIQNILYCSVVEMDIS